MENAVKASAILFGNNTTDSLEGIAENTFLSVLEGVPSFEIPSGMIEKGIPALDLLAEHTKIFPSKGEARRMISGNGLSIFKKGIKEKLSDADLVIGNEYLIKNRYILFLKGKKNYCIVRLTD